MRNHRRAVLFVALFCCGLASTLAAAANAAALTPAGGGWYWQNPCPMRVGEVKDIVFAGPGEIYALGMGSGLGHSSDGGATWELLPSPPGWRSMCFADADNGWVVGGLRLGEQTLGHTADGGRTWVETPVPRTMAVSAIDFVDATHGFAIGEVVDPPRSYQGPPTFFWTADGGATWQSRRLPIERAGMRLDFLDADNGWIAVGDGRVGATHDGGQTWTYVQTPARGDYNRDDVTMQFVDVGHGAVYFGVDDPGYDDTIAAVTTADGGATWRKVKVPGLTLNGVAMADAQHLVAFATNDVTFAGVCCTSADGGATWQRHGLSPAAWLPVLAGGPGGLLCAMNRSTILTSVDAGATWQAHSGGFIGTFSDVTCVGGEAWAVGSRFDVDSPSFVDLLLSLYEPWDWRPETGLLLHAADGVTWHEERLPDGVAFGAVAFGTRARGWALAYEGWEPEEGGQAIYVTSDSGTTWTRQYGGDDMLEDLCVLGEDRAWAVSATSVLRTTDGGQTWQESPVTGADDLHKVVFVDALRGWVAGTDAQGRPAVYRTADGGRTWLRQALPAKPGSVSALRFSDAGHGWLLVAEDEYDQRLLRTTDGGVTWFSTGLPETMMLNDLVFDSADDGLGVGDSVYRTTDGGATWQDLTIGVTGGIEDGDLFAVTGSDAAHAWAVGGGGSILSTIDTVADTSPPSTFDDFDRAWHKRDVAIALTAGDIGGSGLARTEYRVDGEKAWRTGAGYVFGAPVSGLGDGMHYLTYRSVDNAGNAELAKTLRVPIDTRAPEVTRLRVRTLVQHERRTVLRYRITDRLSPRACVKVSIVDRRGRTVRRFPEVMVRTGRDVSMAFKAPRRLRRCRLLVRPRDLAGNTGWGEWASFQVTAVSGSPTISATARPRRSVHE